eukprot:CAMPEP_0177653270 /NCGR_PEP_ID=MMETSP0447-20121125/13641_1 /TAXON_ID=0 /ORGANISM="Stygamoeba regulata, Strain BSH-02190019" /LENGTH=197 /DNA_ID=CAMNT_0019156705 /DNA_START=167 /DNA_END=760 /DNA_ORIENTATION=+
MSARVTGSELAHSEKWLCLKNLKWVDESGKERVWETAERTTRKECGCDAVAVLAIKKQAGREDELVVITQFRPPIAKYAVELPAGLIDANETAEAAGLRELMEEVGYTGRAVRLSPVVCNDPGMSGANMQLLVVEVDGDLPVNQQPKQQLDEGEHIAVHHVPVRELEKHLLEFDSKGFQVDARLWHFAAGLAVADSL